ncbi:MAG: hypothetical protein JKY65_05395 [Planctomycetes bacterium]|nr:hypothetical protein [Planctomycetota bacterium]
MIPLRARDHGQKIRAATPQAWRAAFVSTLLLSCLALATPASAQEPKAPTPKASPAAKPASKSVVLIQESNGFPGGEKKAAGLALQEVWVEKGQLRIFDRGNLYGMYIDLGKKLVEEVSFSTKEYHERAFSYYDKYRREREAALKGQRDEFVRGSKRRKGKDLAAWRKEYREIGGDPDQPGRLRASLEHIKKDRKTLVILVDRVETKVTVDHYLIRENKAKKPIFDLWITTDIKLPVDLFRFYTEMGTFSQPVTKQLLGLKGTILSCDAVLDTGTFYRMFKTRIKEVRFEPGPGDLAFNAKKLGVKLPGPKGGAPKAGPTGPKPKCTICGKVIAAKPIKFREPWGRRRVFLVDTTDCRKKLVKKLIAERKRSKKPK